MNRNSYIFKVRRWRARNSTETLVKIPNDWLEDTRYVKVSKKDEYIILEPVA